MDGRELMTVRLQVVASSATLRAEYLPFDSIFRSRNLLRTVGVFDHTTREPRGAEDCSADYLM